MKVNDSGVPFWVGNADCVRDGLGTRARRGIHLHRGVVVAEELRWSNQAFAISEDEPSDIRLPERHGARHGLSEAVAAEADHASSGQSKALGREVLAGSASHDGAS